MAAQARCKEGTQDNSGGSMTTQELLDEWERLASEQKFPPRIVALRESIKEPHDPIDAIVLDPDGLLHPIHDVVYVSLSEHQHLMAEKDKRIERLREALRYYAGYMSGDAIEFTESGWQKYPDPKIAAAALQEETK